MKKPRTWTVASAHVRLEHEATAILRGASAGKRAEGALVVDLLNARDAERRERRRVNLLTGNKEAAKAFLEVGRTPSSEDLLISGEREKQAKAALQAVFAHFEHEYAVKAILIAHLMHGIPYMRTNKLAEACGLKEATVNSAKKKLRYYAKTHLGGSFEDFLSTFKGEA